MSFDPRSQSNIYKTEKYWPGQFGLGAGIIVLEKLVHIITKVYIPSNIENQINIVRFCFWADWAIRAVLKISAVLQSILLFGVVFMGKTNTKQEIL